VINEIASLRSQRKIKMKIKNYVLIFTAVAVLTLLYGCGSDTVTGNNNGGNPTSDSLLYRSDSIVLYAGGSNYFQVLWSDTILATFRIKFTGVTNDTNTRLELFHGMGATGLTMDSLKGNEINTAYNKLLGGGPNISNWFWALDLEFNNGVIDPTKYIKIRNFEIYKVN